MRVNDLYKGLEEIRKLEYNWDGHHGRGFSDKVVNRAREVVVYMIERNMGLPSIAVPCAGGKRIQFEYKGEGKLKGTELDLDGNDFGLLLPNEDEHHLESLEKIVDLMKKFGEN
jgi:hypothetical protein